MASGPITSNRWGNNGNNDRLFWRASKSLLASLVAQTEKNLPAMQQTQVRSLSWEDPLEEGMATHPFLSGEPHGQRSLAGYSPWNFKASDTTEQLTLSLSGRNHWIFKKWIFFKDTLLFVPFSFYSLFREYMVENILMPDFFQGWETNF